MILNPLSLKSKHSCPNKQYTIYCQVAILTLTQITYDANVNENVLPCLFAFQSEAWWWKGKRVRMDNDVDLIYNLTYLGSTWITIKDFIKIYPTVLECLANILYILSFVRLHRRLCRFKVKISLGTVIK